MNAKFRWQTNIVTVKLKYRYCSLLFAKIFHSEDPFLGLYDLSCQGHAVYCCWCYRSHNKKLSPLMTICGLTYRGVSKLMTLFFVTTLFSHLSATKTERIFFESSIVTKRPFLVTKMRWASATSISFMGIVTHTLGESPCLTDRCRFISLFGVGVPLCVKKKKKRKKEKEKKSRRNTFLKM